MLKMRSARVWITRIAATAVVAVPSMASAESVAYIDGNEVWVSTLDGAHKKRLSAGENEWRDVAHSSDGKVLGVKLESGKISQLAFHTMWDAAGNIEKTSILPNAHVGWSLAAPLNIDLVPGGATMVWGYSALYYSFPTSTLSRGTYFAPVGSPLEPLRIYDMKYPALAGRRLVAVGGRTIYSQNDIPSAPYSNEASDYTPWIDTSDTGDSTWDLDGVATSADGRRVAAWLTKRDAGSSDVVNSAIDVIFTNGLGNQSGVTSCYLPLQGIARTTPSISADGGYISWHDDGGLKVAPMPSVGTPGQPCVMAGATVVISATGSQPDLGGFPVPTAGAPGGPGGTGGPGSPVTPTTPAQLARITVTSPVRALAKNVSSKGVTVTLRPMSAPGRATVRLLVPGNLLGRRSKAPVVVGTVATNVRKGVATKVVVRPGAKWRARVAKMTNRTVRVQVIFRGKTTTKNLRLR